jgi:hypothetical protein
MGTTTSALDLAAHLRRSHGRSGRTFVASAKVTRTELAELETTARADGKALSEWARETLLREARKSDAGPLWTEIIANRMLLMAVLRPIATGQKITPERFDELLAKIKSEKRSAAHEVMAQYKADVAKECKDGE